MSGWNAVVNLVAISIIAMGVLIVVALRMFDIVVYPLLFAFVLAGIILVVLLVIMYFMGLLEDDDEDEEETEEQRLQRRRSEVQRARIVSGILTIMLVAYCTYNAITPSPSAPPKYDDNLSQVDELHS